MRIRVNAKNRCVRSDGQYNGCKWPWIWRVNNHRGWRDLRGECKMQCPRDSRGLLCTKSQPMFAPPNARCASVITMAHHWILINLTGIGCLEASFPPHCSDLEMMTGKYRKIWEGRDPAARLVVWGHGRSHPTNWGPGVPPRQGISRLNDGGFRTSDIMLGAYRWTEGSPMKIFDYFALLCSNYVDRAQSHL